MEMPKYGGKTTPPVSITDPTTLLFKPQQTHFHHISLLKLSVIFFFSEKKRSGRISSVLRRVDSLAAEKKKNTRYTMYTPPEPKVYCANEENRSSENIDPLLISPGIHR